MYWHLLVVESCDPPSDTEKAGTRFVLHRHRDAVGPHLDLRLEFDGFLGGWRIAADALRAGVSAEEKGAHPTAWLDQDGDACRIDAGVYAWEERSADCWKIRLDGTRRSLRLTWRREAGLSPDIIQALSQKAADLRLPAVDLPGLIDDGITARNRAIARICGLGHQLEPVGFDESAWRSLLAPLSLSAIERHLAGFEIRADRAAPPAPVSRPEVLDEPETPTPRARGWRLLRG